MRISVIGLGKLGSPLAAVLAEKGHNVIGVDVDPAKVAAIVAGEAPVHEPGLPEMIFRNRQRLHATTDCADAVARTEATFIIVPTPSDEGGGFSNAYVEAAAIAIGLGLRRKKGYHLVSLTSTVMPGTTGGVLLPLLERHSGLRGGVDFGLCYNPEFIALGSVIADLLRPDLVLIGEGDTRAGDTLAAMYGGVCEHAPAMVRSNYINAEIAKIALNTFVTTKISYANMLAELCEKLPGADVDAVTRAIGADGRVGPKYLKGAVSFGGPCFPRDNRALAALARQLGVRADLPEATDRVNLWQAQRIVHVALARLQAGGTVGILGLAYKAATEVCEASMGVELARLLTQKGVRVVGYDSLAVPAARRILPAEVRLTTSLQECARQADVLILPLMAEDIRRLSPSDLKAGPPRPVVIDCWRMLDAAAFGAVAEHLAVGRSGA